MLLRHTAKLYAEADSVEIAIEQVLRAGMRTADLLRPTSAPRPPAPRRWATASPRPRSKRSTRAWPTMQSEGGPELSTNARVRLFDKLWRRISSTRPRGSRLCSTSICISCTRSPRRRPLKVCGSPAASVRRTDLTFGTVDHNMPTTRAASLQYSRSHCPPADRALRKNCADFGVQLADIGTAEQGIVHVIGPELGLTLPGKTIVCGDSHTSTHGAFGALAFGIGTSEVEHVLATQTLSRSVPRPC